MPEVDDVICWKLFRVTENGVLAPAVHTTGKVFDFISPNHWTHLEADDEDLPDSIHFRLSDEEEYEGDYSLKPVDMAASNRRRRLIRIHRRNPTLTIPTGKIWSKRDDSHLEHTSHHGFYSFRTPEDALEYYFEIKNFASFRRSPCTKTNWVLGKIRIWGIIIEGTKCNVHEWLELLELYSPANKNTRRALGHHMPGWPGRIKALDEVVSEWHSLEGLRESEKWRSPLQRLLLLSSNPQSRSLQFRYPPNTKEEVDQRIRILEELQAEARLHESKQP